MRGMSETWFGVGASAPLPDVRPCRLLRQLALKVPRFNYFKEGISLATDGRQLAFGRTRAAVAPRAGQTAPEIYAHS